MTKTTPASERLFLALWPDEAVRGRLESARRALNVAGGRLIRAANLHVTLVFLGAVSAERRVCIEQACQSVRARPFELALGEVAWKPRTGIVWLGAQESPAALADLVASLNGALAACAHEPEARVFRPHVTLWRDVRKTDKRREIAPIYWNVQDFCLVASTLGAGGSVYAVQRRWSLG